MIYTTPVTSISGIGPQYVEKLSKLGIKTVFDLIHHIPARYKDFSKIYKVYNFPKGATGTIIGEITDFKNQYTKNGKRMQIAILADDTGTMQAVWFNQSFLAQTLKIGSRIALAGECGWWAKGKALYAPDYEIPENDLLIHTGRQVPIYPETKGITSKWLRSKIWQVLHSNFEFDEFLPREILDDNKLMTVTKALESIHFPEKLEDTLPARERLALNELVFLQLQNVNKKRDWQANSPSYLLEVDTSKVDQFMSSLPFQLTVAQQRSVVEICQDLKKSIPMNRLLEGDVGSGKTVVAAIAAYICHLNKHQTVIMAPTQILAEQHYKTLQNLFSGLRLSIGLVTGSHKIDTKKEYDIYVGTHALIHKGVKFDNVALVVIDEQHRFGVEQRAHLVKKSEKGKFAPHVLTMTATPIPRSVALTLYGELDLSVLDELPAGREKITTWVIPPTKRDGAYKWIKEQIITNSSQAFIVCPLIDESESESLSQVKAATVEFESLKSIFKELRLGLLHGRMNNSEKSAVLDHFRYGKIDILVTTPVVEVGVDVPNATIMMIETAERFGLAQLHQLRGRVGRGQKQSYCMLFTENKAKSSIERLTAMKNLSSGFELAELDLKLRGAGEVMGIKQHGLKELKIANWQDVALMKLSRKIAESSLENLPEYAKLLIAYKEMQIINN